MSFTKKSHRAWTALAVCLFLAASSVCTEGYSAGTVTLSDPESKMYGMFGPETINTVVMHGGSFYNGINGSSTVFVLELNGGSFYNGISYNYGPSPQILYGSGTVKNAVMNGGTFYNGAAGSSSASGLSDGGGFVENLLYKGGTYYSNSESVLAKLTLGKADITAEERAQFGNVKELAFTADYALGMTKTSDGKYHLQGGNVSADAINLAGVAIILDLEGAYSTLPGTTRTAWNVQTGFALPTWEELFADYETVSDTDSVKSFVVRFNGSEQYYDVQDIMHGTAAESALTPEPATLALFGLGLAGLAAARRRKK